MRTSNLKIYLIDDKSNKYFNDMINLINKRFSIFLFTDLSAVVELSKRIVPDLIIFNAKFISFKSLSIIAEYISNTSIKCLVAGELENSRLEIEMRKLNDTCYLMLPEETSMFLDYINYIAK